MVASAERPSPCAGEPAWPALPACLAVGGCVAWLQCTFQGQGLLQGIMLAWAADTNQNPSHSPAGVDLHAAGVRFASVHGETQALA